jgi:dipeptidyl aminopeptidase/acylaminoacyl peptidase
LSLTLKKIADGAETKVALPAGAKPGRPEWSPDGRYFAFPNITATGVELWVGEAATGQTRKLPGVTLNAAYGDPLEWMPGSRELLVRLVPAGCGKPPARPLVPLGPNIQESSGKGAPVWTHQDLLTCPYDEDLFDYYAASQLAVVDVVSGRVTPIGKPALFQTASPAPEGKHLLVARVHRPYSYLYPHLFFPKEVEVWDRSGKAVYKLASLPLADAVPPEGVATGPRNYHWRPTAPATLAWTEALDGGDPKRKAPHRDRLLMLPAPFSGQPTELVKTEHRLMGTYWVEREGRLVIGEYDRDRRWRRIFLLEADRPSEPPRLLWSLSVRERYRDPGSPVFRTLPTGHRVILQHGDAIYFEGEGASPEGDRPFLDRLDLKTLKAERLFRCDAKSFESVVGLLSDDGQRFITRRESPSDPPNYFVRTLGAAEPRALTQYPDPAPALRGITKRLVTYQRPDGVQLSFTLYLPPGSKEGTRLPTVVWAYPLEHSDPGTAGQVAGSAQRFTSISGMSHLFFLLEGYAILDNATMPVVGDPETVNNTYVEQIVASAKAAIDKAAELGVTDPARVGVGGHSYGAFMTANLLAHSDLFRAGIARSGAYNRTLTPFGFQSERRTLWEAPELYLKMSPFFYADKLKEPMLLIHGEADNNSGTFPIQSERLYQALRGNGGTVRLVMLPHESHGYLARESVEHTLYEMIAWFDKYVKNAGPR